MFSLKNVGEIINGNINKITNEVGTKADVLAPAFTFGKAFSAEATVEQELALVA